MKRNRNEYDIGKDHGIGLGSELRKRAIHSKSSKLKSEEIIQFQTSYVRSLVKVPAR